MGAKPKDTSITVTAYGTKVAAVSAKSLKRNAIGLGPLLVCILWLLVTSSVSVLTRSIENAEIEKRLMNEKTLLRTQAKHQSDHHFDCHFKEKLIVQ